MPKRTAVRFSKETAKTFTLAAGEKQAFLYFTEPAGLGLRVTSGGKSWIFQSRSPTTNQTFRLTLGDYSAIPFIEASKIALQLATTVAQGIDPREARAAKQEAAAQQVRQVERQALTIREVLPTYIEAKQSQWSASYTRQHEQMLAPVGVAKRRGKGTTTAKPIHGLLDAKLTELNSEMLEGWMRDNLHRPTQTAQTFRMVKALLNWCELRKEYQGLVPAAARTGAIARNTLPKSKARDGCLQREQLPAWFAAVQTLAPVPAAYLQVCLLTGARREEVLSIKWDDVDFKWKTINIRDKVEGQRVIPLTPYVESLVLTLRHLNGLSPSVRALRRMEDRGETFTPSEWVFFSRTAANGRFQEPRKALARIAELSGIDELTVHDLRRSFSSLTEWVECPAGIVAQIMGHKPSAIAEKHYKRRPIDLLRAWHIKIEDWILKEGGVHFTAAADSPKPVLVPLAKAGVPT